MDLTSALLIAGLALLVVLLSLKVLSSPLRLAGRAALNALMGLGALLLVNAAAPLTGLHLGLNLVNSLVAGIFGLPGLGLLVLLRWVLL